MSIKNDFWLWGQTAGTHHEEGNNMYKLPGVNKMTPLEGAKYFGIENMCAVVMQDKPAVEDFPALADELSEMKKVVWSIIGNGGSKRNNNGGNDMDAMLRVAKTHSNIIAGVADDFMRPSRLAVYTPEIIKGYKERLRTEAGRPLDFWSVIYTHELSEKVREHLDVFDVVTLWNWYSEELLHLDESLARLKSLTDKPILAGCYMWDYGNKKPLSMDLMKLQLEKYLEWYEQKKIQGVILCSNCIADIGLDTAEYMKEWLSQQ